MYTRRFAFRLTAVAAAAALSLPFLTSGSLALDSGGAVRSNTTAGTAAAGQYPAAFAKKAANTSSGNTAKAVSPNTKTAVKSGLSVKTANVQADTDMAAPGNFSYRDVYSDTWTLTDELKRTMPSYQSAADSPVQKKVGMFYFICHDQSDMTLYDHTALYQSGGLQAIDNLFQNGPIGQSEYWGQPYFGYYRSDDRWVIRKHAEMLSEAGVDFVFFDISNAVTYDKMYQTIFSEWEAMRQEGMKTPQIVYFCGDNPDICFSDFQNVWNNIYSKGLYKDLWFTVNGKPLIFSNDTDILKDASLKSAISSFTVRRSWAYNGWTTSGIGKWPWLGEYPQKPGKSPSGILEQLVVSAGFHATTSRGRSYANGMENSDNTAGSGQSSDYEFQNPNTPLGLAYAEEFKQAFALDPQYLLITGWNEWTAGKWNENGKEYFANTFMAQPNSPHPYVYVDNFNAEFSRDVEPMSGGFTDNYYAQTVENLWKYKGMRPLDAAFGQKTIDLGGSFDQWNGVGPEYRDNIGDIMARDCHSQIAGISYQNNSGRNDFATAKVSEDADNYYFYINTDKPIVRDNGSNWMNLYINTDDSYSTGWEGYDYILNRSRTANTVSIEKNAGNGWNWTSVGNASYTVSGNKMMIRVPKSLVPANQKSFDFKWADNSIKDGDVMQFYDQGDTAPDGRFAYRYTTVATPAPALSQLLGTALQKTVLSFRSNSYEAYVGKKKVMLDSGNTNITPTAVNGDLYVPLSFLKANSSLKLDGLAAVTLNGEAYVDLNDVAKLNHETLSTGSDGIAVLSPHGVTCDVLDQLDRIL